MRKKLKTYSTRLFQSQGYVWIKIPRHPNAREGWVVLHRWIMEKKLRRFLKPTEVVHHLNKDKQDNRIENLVLMSRLHHRIVHARNIADISKTTAFFSDIGADFVYDKFGEGKHSLFDEEYYQWHTQRQLKKLGVDKNRKS